jgi:hypothetical protein
MSAVTLSEISMKSIVSRYANQRMFTIGCGQSLAKRWLAANLSSRVHWHQNKFGYRRRLRPALLGSERTAPVVKANQRLTVANRCPRRHWAAKVISATGKPRRGRKGTPNVKWIYCQLSSRIMLRGRRGKFELIERLFPLSVLYISRLLHQATEPRRSVTGTKSEVIETVFGRQALDCCCRAQDERQP